MASFTDWARPDTYPYLVQEIAQFRPANQPTFEVGQTMRYPVHEFTERQLSRGVDATGSSEAASESAMLRARGFAGVGSALETRDDLWSSVVNPWVQQNGLPPMMEPGFDSNTAFDEMGTVDTGYHFPGNSATIYKGDRIDLDGVQERYQN